MQLRIEEISSIIKSQSEGHDKAVGVVETGTVITVGSAAPLSRSPVWYALAVALFLAAGLGIASLKRVESNRAAAAARTDRWDLPVRHPAGLAFDGKSLWLVEWFTQSFYALSTVDTNVQLVRHLTAETPVAAAFTSEALWTVSADGTVIRRMRDDKMTPLMRYPKAAPNSAGLAFDGLYLWSLDARAHSSHDTSRPWYNWYNASFMVCMPYFFPDCIIE